MTVIRSTWRSPGSTLSGMFPRPPPHDHLQRNVVQLHMPRLTWDKGVYVESGCHQQAQLELCFLLLL